MSSIPDTPKLALEACLIEIEKEYLSWYDSSVKWLRLAA